MCCGCVAAQTLSRSRVGESLADKIIKKLGGAAHYTIAGDQDILQVAGRTIHQQLSKKTLIVGIDFKENETYAAAGDQSAVSVVASDAALNQFFYAADGIDNNNDAAAVVRALECVLKQVKDVGFAPDDVLVYRSGRGLSETQLKDLRDNEVRAAAPRIFIFSPIIPCSRFITRSPKSSGRSTPCSEATTRSPTSPTRE